MAPAKVTKILLDEDGHTMEVIVPDEQLSLAIGRKGQNVRLASRLTGWGIDARSESEADEESRVARQSLSAIPGVSEVMAELLYQSGFKSAEDLSEAEPATINEITGIEPEKASAILEAAAQHVEEERERLAREAEEAAQAAEEAAAAAEAGEAVETEGESDQTEGDAVDTADETVATEGEPGETAEEAAATAGETAAAGEAAEAPAATSDEEEVESSSRQGA